MYGCVFVYVLVFVLYIGHFSIFYFVENTTVATNVYFYIPKNKKELEHILL